jgi:hypothetical protein
VSGCGAGECIPVGTNIIDSFAVSLLNIGGEAEWYVNGTGPDPFEIRTAYSSDGTVGIFQEPDKVDFTIDIDSLVSVVNVGGESQWYVVGSSGPFKIRTAYSSDGSVSIVQEVEKVDITVPVVSGAEVFQVDGTAVKSTGQPTYQLVEILATDPLTQIKDEEQWKINLCILICHPTGLFNINTWVRWSIETAAGVFTPIDEWQVNWPITIQQGEPSAPAHRTVDVVVAFDDPRMLCEVRMSALTGAATQVELARWGGVQIAPAP